MTIIIFFIFGLIAGSFLNVVISRLPRMESLLGRSRCPKCKSKIRWHDNIPLLSYVVLGTHCRDCKEKISWQYPLVEGATGILFALTGAYFFDVGDFQSWWETLFLLIAFSLLIIIFVYDFEHLEVPMMIVWAGVVVAAAYYLIFDLLYFSPTLGIMSSRFFSAVLAAVFAYVFFFLLSAGSREKWMGMGDAYVAMLVGLIVGWPNFIFALLLAFTIGAVCGIILIVGGKKTFKSRVPFAPFLTIGTVLTVLAPRIFPAISYWYLNFT